jgi:hypothetical protein
MNFLMHHNLKTDGGQFTCGHADPMQGMEAEVALLWVKLKDVTKWLKDSHGDLMDEQCKEQVCYWLLE